MSARPHSGRQQGLPNGKAMTGSGPGGESFDSSRSDGNAQAGRASRASRRNEALKAKNRRAQARYRERQKEKFADYKTAVEDLTEQLNKLSAEKDALAADKAMLESCLQLSYQKGLTCSSGNETLELVSSSTENYQNAIWKTARVDGPLLDAMLSVFSKARKACNLPPLSRAEVENTMLHEVFNRKEMCVQGTAALLSKLDREGTEEAFQELVDYMKEQAAMFNLLYTQHGQLARVMEASHVQTSRAKFGMPTSRFWAGVADSLNLTEQQQARMLQLRRQLLMRMEDVRQKRVNVLSSIQGTFPSNINFDSNGNSFSGTFVQGTHSVDLLRQSLHQEHRTTHDFAGAIRRTVLSPYQHASLEVCSFPHKVDLLAICDVIAERCANKTQASSEDAGLSLHESPSGLAALEQLAAELGPLEASPQAPQDNLLLASSSEAEGAPHWISSPASEPAPAPVSTPMQAPSSPAGVAESGESSGPLEGPRLSFKFRNSEMEALLMDL